MLFDNLYGLLRVVVISGLAYAGLIFALRVTGKRALAKLNAFDLVVTVALGSTLATVLLTKDVALLEGLLAFAMLMALQWAVARLSIASPGFRRLVRSEPRLLVEDGAYRHGAMRAERVTSGEIEAAVRSTRELDYPMITMPLTRFTAAGCLPIHETARDDGALHFVNAMGELNAFATTTLGSARTVATTASGTGSSTETSASALPPSGRRPRLKFAMLMPASPSTVPRRPIRPGLSSLRTNSIAAGQSAAIAIAS